MTTASKSSTSLAPHVRADQSWQPTRRPKDRPFQRSLTGRDWQMKGFLGSTELREAQSSAHGWIPASVPGTVHHDLWKHGDISDPYVGENSKFSEWTSARTWMYRKTFSVPASELGNGQRVRLHFEGVDHAATFLLNGEVLGTHEGMFTPVDFEIGDKLRAGENTLTVMLAPAPDNQPQMGSTAKVHSDKNRMNYGWDFTPRVVEQGIWNDVRLELSGQARVAQVYVRPKLSKDFRSADVAVQTQLDASSARTVTVETELRLQGHVVGRTQHRVEVAAGQKTLTQHLKVSEPKLWFPNGAGAQPVYDATVRVVDTETGAVSHERTERFGFREISLAPNAGADASAQPFTLQVNGRKLYAKGWNWVPPDMMYGVDQPEKIERLFQLAKRANVNLLRIWGGGGIERERVYELADKYGIMLWQEFPLTGSGDGSTPSEDPRYIRMLQDEARQVVPLKRNHPSLAIWGGGNELHDSMDLTPTPDTLPKVVQAIGQVVGALDPERAYLATSPLARSAPSDLPPQEVHGPYFHMGTERLYTLYNRGSSLLSSEFGTEGLNNQDVLDATVPAERVQPISRDNDTWVHRGEWWINAVMLEKTFGKFGGDLPSLQRASQMFQRDGLQYAVESNVRRWPQNSGSLPWQFNEPFPSGFGTNAVDFFAHPKPVYYGVARAYAPVTVTARFDRQAWGGHPNFEAEIWVGNTQAKALGVVSADVRVVGADGTEYLNQTQTTSLGGDDVQTSGRIRVPLKQIHQEVFFLDLALKDAAGRVVGSNRYTFSRTKDLQPLRKVDQTTVEMTVTERGSHWEVTLTNAGKTAALGVRIEDARELGSKGGPYFSDDDFPLLPGESRVIRVDWSNVSPSARRLKLDAWNVANHGCRSKKS